MASSTLTLAPDLIDSWLFRQLRPTADVPIVKAKPVARATEQAEPVEAPELLTTEQEAKILAHAAREFQTDFEPVLGSLNNIHGRSFDDVSQPFGQRLGALAVALEASDFESARAAANRLSLVVTEMQANVPAWNYVRGLQLLVRRCSKLGV